MIPTITTTRCRPWFKKGLPTASRSRETTPARAPSTTPTITFTGIPGGIMALKTANVGTSFPPSTSTNSPSAAEENFCATPHARWICWWEDGRSAPTGSRNPALPSPRATPTVTTIATPDPANQTSSAQSIPGSPETNGLPWRPLCFLIPLCPRQTRAQQPLAPPPGPGKSRRAAASEMSRATPCSDRISSMPTSRSESTLRSPKA
jgi:hypothetical protein